MQNSTGLVKIGFSIPEEDYEWMLEYILKEGFHTNVSDFTSSAILKMMDLLSSVKSIERPDALNGLLSFLRINFFETVPSDGGIAKIQVRIPDGQVKRLDWLCTDLMHNAPKNPMFQGELVTVRRRLVITAIRYYIQYRNALSASVELPASYKKPRARGSSVRALIDMDVMCSGTNLESL